jgi:hypothetical protein
VLKDLDEGGLTVIAAGRVRAINNLLMATCSPQTRLPCSTTSVRAVRCQKNLRGGWTRAGTEVMERSAAAAGREWF